MEILWKMPPLYCNMAQLHFPPLVFTVRLVWKKHENKLQRAARQAAAREKFEIFRY